MNELNLSIIGNCQISPLSLSLEFLNPTVRVVLQKTALADLRFDVSEMKKVQNSDFIILVERRIEEFINTNSYQVLMEKNVIEVPSILFSAFHPDIAYAKINGKWIKNGILSDWQSTLVLAGYSLKIEPKQLSELIIRSNLLERIGFTSTWAQSSLALKKEFDLRNFNYEIWINVVRNHGSFMWGINHPKIASVAELSKQVIQKIGLEPQYATSVVSDYIDDPLANIVWPIYPKVADNFAITGASMFRHSSYRVDLEEFIRLCYSAWNRDNLKVDNIQLIGSTLSLNDIADVLKEYL